MICPKCGSENVFVQAVTETKQKAKKGLLYWLFIGWWWELFAWLFLTLPKLIIAIFGNHKKTVSKTSTQAVCQNCGNRWVVSNSQIKQAAQQNETHTVQQNVLRSTADQPIDVAASNSTEENTMEKIKNFFKSTGALFKTNTGNMIFVVVASLILGGMLFGGSSGEESTKQIQNDNASVTVSDQAVTEKQQNEASAETTPTEKQITKYAAGAYKIGADMPAGVYVVYASGSGYLCISSDSNQEDIIDNDIFCGNRYIEVSDGQYLSLSSAYAISIADYVPVETPATLSDGMYLVGTDIPAGEYKVTADSGSGYWAIYNKPIGASDIVDNNLFESSSYVTVKDGQYLCVSGGSFVVE